MEITIGKRIKQLIKETKIQQQQIAAELGMHSSTLSSYVIDYREPPVEKLKRIAKYFDVSVDYLTGYTERRKPYPNHFPEEVIEFISDPQNLMYLKLAMNFKEVVTDAFLKEKPLDEPKD